MDKKIILSVLIVAIIGIVSATYQINTGVDILNPLSNVETEDTPITDVLTAPETQDDTQAEIEAQQAQAEAQRQAELDAQKAEQEANQQQNNTQQATTGTTQKRSNLVSSDTPLVVTETSNDNNPSPSPSPNVQDDEGELVQVTDNLKETIESIIKPKIDSDQLTLNYDDCKFKDNKYQIKAYDKQNNYAGSFFVDIDDKSWYFITKDGVTIVDETPNPEDTDKNGELVTD